MFVCDCLYVNKSVYVNTYRVEESSVRGRVCMCVGAWLCESTYQRQSTKARGKRGKTKHSFGRGGPQCLHKREKIERERDWDREKKVTLTMFSLKNAASIK